jgi:hypothetical protein
MKYLIFFLILSFWQFAYANDSEVVQQLRDLKNLEKRLINEEKKNQSISENVTATKLCVENIKEHVKGLENSSNSSNESLKNLVEKISVVSSVLNEVQSSLEHQVSLSRNINNDINRTSIYSDWIQPIILSIIAAIIFWYFFSYRPEERRTRQIRKKVDINLFQIYNDLFAIFNMLLRPNSYSPSFEQQKIRSGNLKEEDIFLGLQDKCLNETYCYDKNIVQALKPIGKELHKIYSSIENKIDSIFHFSSCLTPDEILLLEKIRTILNVYGLDNYDRNAVSVVAGQTLYPVNPSISYMTKNLF